MIFIRLNFLLLLLTVMVMPGCVKEQNADSQASNQINNIVETTTDRGDPEDLQECEYYIRINSVSPSNAVYYLVLRNLADGKPFFTSCNNLDSDPCQLGTGFVNANLGQWYKLSIPAGLTNFKVDIGTMFMPFPSCASAASGSTINYSIKGIPMPYPLNFYTSTVTWLGPNSLPVTDEYSINNSTCVVQQQSGG